MCAVVSRVRATDIGDLEGWRRNGTWTFDRDIVVVLVILVSLIVGFRLLFVFHF